MDTPIFDGVLSDRLGGARESAERAGRDAETFRAALDAGQRQAVEELARQRAEQLTTERTAALTARVTHLEQLLQRAYAERVHAERTSEAEPATPVAPVQEEQAAKQDTPPTTPATTPPTTTPSTTPPTARPVPVVPRPAVDRTTPGRAGDQGPTGADVPSVPSMRDIFASTRAAGWLDSLLGSKR